MQTMNIGRLAKLAEVKIDTTIRYYERQQLMPQAARTASGYRQHTHEDLERLRFIFRSKDLGFTLAEIGELLSLTNDRESDMHGVKRKAEQRLSQVGELRGGPIVAALCQNTSNAGGSR